MPAKDPGSIISDGLLNVYDLHFRRRQAELDYERAKTEEAVGSRAVVPGVFAQLAEQREKEAKRREQAQKAGEKQQPPAQAMLPPMTQTDGRPQVGGTGIGTLAEGIQAFTSGGGGIKRQQAGGGTLATSLGTGSPVLAAAGEAVLRGAVPGVPAQGTPAAAGIQGPATITTQVQNEEEPFKTRLLRAGLNVLGGRAGFGGLGNAIIPGPGTSTIVQHIPGPQEEQDRIQNEGLLEAKPLVSALREAQEKIGTKEAGEAGKRVVSIVSDIQKRRGADVAQSAVRFGAASVLEEQQKERAATARAQARGAATAERQTQLDMEREARRASKASAQLKEKVAEITLRGGPQNDQERNILETYERLDPIERLTGRAVEKALREREGGAATAPKVPTQAEVNASYDKLKSALGREPTREEIKADLLGAR